MTVQTVFKYPFAVGDVAGVVLPEGASILHVDRDPAFPEGAGQLAVWALVDPSREPTVRTDLHVAGTGHPLPEKATAPAWRASVVDGPFVWHVFEVSW